MFGKKESKERKVTVRISDEKIHIKGEGLSLNEIEAVVHGFAEIVEQNTDMKATTFLTKCAFDLLP